MEYLGYAPSSPPKSMILKKLIFSIFQPNSNLSHFFCIYSSGSLKFVSVSEAEAVAEMMGSLYQEASAQTGEHVDKVFGSAVKLAHDNRKGDHANLSRLRRFNKFDSGWLPPISKYMTTEINNLCSILAML